MPIRRCSHRDLVSPEMTHLETAIQVSGGLGSSRRTLLDQSLDGRRRLGADTDPVGQTVLHDAQAFFATFCNRVIKTDALDKATITPNALVSDDDIEKWAMLGTAACKSDDDHNLSLGGGVWQ